MGQWYVKQVPNICRCILCETVIHLECQLFLLTHGKAVAVFVFQLLVEEMIFFGTET